MKLRIGFSPCPNDTFIFDALVNGKIDTMDLEFEPVLEDVETLNKWAEAGKLDITKLSFPAYFKAKNFYSLLHSGSALGKGVGPLLVTNAKKNFSAEAVNRATVVLPGINTTANLLFSFAYPQTVRKKYAVFHEIEDMVAKSKADLGVIIHENRFTYKAKGLKLVKDLGAHWEEKMKVPVPLGGIAVRTDLGRGLYNEINTLIRLSLEHAFAGYPEISAYVKLHAQAMDETVMRKHIDLYVNDYTLDLGADGLNAVNVLESVYDQSTAEK